MLSLGLLLLVTAVSTAIAVATAGPASIAAALTAAKCLHPSSLMTGHQVGFLHTTHGRGVLVDTAAVPFCGRRRPEDMRGPGGDCTNSGRRQYPKAAAATSSTAVPPLLLPISCARRTASTTSSSSDNPAAPVVIPVTRAPRRSARSCWAVIASLRGGFSHLIHSAEMDKVFAPEADFLLQPFQCIRGLQRQAHPTSPELLRREVRVLLADPDQAASREALQHKLQLPPHHRIRRTALQLQADHAKCPGIGPRFQITDPTVEPGGLRGAPSP
mmetsp:Transcript_23136/g.49277  ORF Transcript_23136/g.49277 Transcript_23136/m.49277 type:complete len:272 (-) Transcript_23136:869-1684(-)